MIDKIAVIFFQQGPLGLIAGLFVYLYFNERSKHNESQTKLIDAHKHHYETLDKIRENQIRREQEVAHTLEEYGKGVIEAVQNSTIVAEELRRLHHER